MSNHNHKCSVSTGIHEGLTFGSGELDGNGFWEFPCYECAREWEKEHPEDAPCWPFSEDDLMVIRDKPLNDLSEEELDGAFDKAESGDLL